jgi:GNAT superfamily N-acetyltransferase
VTDDLAGHAERHAEPLHVLTPQQIEIRRVPFSEPRARILLAQADAYNASLYGHADQSSIDPDEFDPKNRGTFLIAYIGDEPVACGGLRAAEAPAPAGACEVKRMFVTETARRRGIGRLILQTLEEAGREFGYPQVVLDVGRKQHNAHAMYESCGYHQIPGFTIYRDIPGNRAYAKNLA